NLKASCIICCLLCVGTPSTSSFSPSTSDSAHAAHVEGPSDLLLDTYHYNFYQSDQNHHFSLYDYQQYQAALHRQQALEEELETWCPVALSSSEVMPKNEATGEDMSSVEGHLQRE
ncbi:hypothetical protein LDENG_00265750, partial [Lucifuga dentata]